MLIIMHWLDGLNVAQHMLAACFATPKHADHNNTRNTFVVQCNWQGSGISIGRVVSDACPDIATMYHVIQKMLSQLPSDNPASKLVDDFQVFHNTILVDNMTSAQLGEALRHKPCVSLGPVTVNQDMLEKLDVFQLLEAMTKPYQASKVFVKMAYQLCKLAHNQHNQHNQLFQSIPRIIRLTSLAAERHDAAWCDFHQQHMVSTIGFLCLAIHRTLRTTHAAGAQLDHDTVSQLVPAARVCLQCTPATHAANKQQHYIADGVDRRVGNMVAQALAGLCHAGGFRQTVWSSNGLVCQLLRNCKICADFRNCPVVVGLHTALAACEHHIQKYEVAIPVELAEPSVFAMKNKCLTGMIILIAMDRLCSQPGLAYGDAVQAGLLDWLAQSRPQRVWPIRVTNRVEEHYHLTKILAVRQSEAFCASMVDVVCSWVWSVIHVHQVAGVLTCVADRLDHQTKAWVVRDLCRHVEINYLRGIDVLASFLAQCLSDQSDQSDQLVRKEFVAGRGICILERWMAQYGDQNRFDVDAVEALCGLLTALRPGSCAGDFGDKRKLEFTRVLDQLLNRSSAIIRATATCGNQDRLVKLHDKFQACRDELDEPGAACKRSKLSIM